MCLYPRLMNGNRVSCRECEQCLAADLNGWVARCMAEKAVAGQMLAVTYTYANLPDGSKPTGATVFKYKDIQNHLKALREAYYRHYGVRGEIRYVICGERGSKGTERSHYHALLFTDKPLGVLGKWHNAITGLEVTTDTKPLDVDLNWSLWPHGFTHFQEPASKGVFYVLKYAFKDRMTVKKAEGTKYATQSLTWAASIFRMSKKPPIGFRFLEQYCDLYASKGLVPPTMKISLPDYKGYYYPRGKLRDYVLQRFHEINSQHYADHRRDCSTWAALLSSVSKPNDLEPENDKEALLYGQIEENPQSDEELAREHQHFIDQIDKSEQSRGARAILKQCGHVVPCKECRLHWSPEQNKELIEDEAKWFDKWAYRHGKPLTSQTITDFRSFWVSLCRPSRGCKRRNDDDVFAIFRAAKGLRKLSKSIRGPSDDLSGRNAAGGKDKSKS